MLKKRKDSGFTLVETLITVVILSIAVIGFTRLLISTQYNAEQNLYESTALNVALSTLEQMKNSSFFQLTQSLENTEFDFQTTSADNIETIDLNAPNILSVPIVTNGTDNKMLNITLTPRIIASGPNAPSDPNAYMLEVEYAYNHPQTGQTRTSVVKCLRSNIKSY